jgi:hypothetical protein
MSTIQLSTLSKTVRETINSSKNQMLLVSPSDIRVSISRLQDGNKLKISFLHSYMPISDLKLWLKGNCEEAKQYIKDMEVAASNVRSAVIKLGVLENQIKKIGL